MLTTTANVALALGLSLLNPAFSEKSGNFMTNVFIVPNVSLLLTIVPLEVSNLQPMDSLLYLTVPLSWLVGTVLLYLGKRKLSRIE
jgi:hypothetical protein